MEDEKELLSKIRNSIKAKKSRAEMLKTLQSRGFSIDYAEALITKAQRPKKIIKTIIFSFVIIFCLAIATVAILFAMSGTNLTKSEIKNPLAGFNVNFEGKSLGNSTPEEIYLEDIEITPEFLSYLLNEIGAWQIHNNPLNGEEPIINFKIEEQTFNSKISESITTVAGLSEKADLQFNSNKETIIRATISENPAQVFKDSINAGTTTIETLRNEADLFSKGYLDLYNSLK